MDYDYEFKVLNFCTKFPPPFEDSDVLEIRIRNIKEPQEPVKIKACLVKRKVLLSVFEDEKANHAMFDILSWAGVLHNPYVMLPMVHKISELARNMVQKELTEYKFAALTLEPPPPDDDDDEKMKVLVTEEPVAPPN